MKSAYSEFQVRAGQISSPKGAKTEMIHAFIHCQSSGFRVADIQRECPGAGVDLIRKTLKSLQARRQVRCLGRGAAASWEKTKKWNFVVPN